MTASEYDKITKQMEDLYKRAKTAEITLPVSIQNDLNLLFSTTKLGFREVAFLVIIARLLKPTYKASRNFYACNPRPFYEGPMAAFLSTRRIPHMKSGPLNVAKAAVALNAQWARQRRPKSAADAVVRLVQYIEKATKDQLTSLGVVFMQRLSKEALRIAELKTELPPDADPDRLSKICRRLIEETPDAGNTPQRIAGLLLECYHSTLNTGVMVSGHTDRASVTNTTSKKPGDIVEEKNGSGLFAVYEVTVKAFDNQRVGESHQAIQAYNARENTSISEVIVICRESDVHGEAIESADGMLGVLNHNGIIYYFLDIFQWVSSRIVGMPQKARKDFAKKLNDYINLPNTSEKVKELWRELNAA